MASKKDKVIGSVAVDSETGMETYGVPKGATSEPGANGQARGLTPNYREKTNGSMQNIAGVPAEFLDLFEHDPSEVIIAQSTKHPVGLWFIVLASMALITLITAGGGLLLVDTNILGAANISAGGKALGAFAVLILSGLVTIIAMAAFMVYKRSRMILTNQKLVFIQYHSLFSREVSQLNIGEVEDVNVAQHTIWDRLFGMGSLTVETSGEQNNYTFSYVAKPFDFARKTIQAHEGSIAEYGN